MKSCQLLKVVSVLTIVTLSTVSCKVVDYHKPIEGKDADAIDNVALPDTQKGPFLQVLSNMEEFVEHSIHTLLENVPAMIASPLHAFHNFTVHIEELGDTIFKRQEGIIHLIQCECPDEFNRCNHILARRISTPYDDERKRAIPDSEPAMPMIDVVQLIRHFQNHLTGVLQTQRKVFEYAQCACPNKKECLKAKATSSGWYKRTEDKKRDSEKNIQEDEGFKSIDKDARDIVVLNETAAAVIEKIIKDKAEATDGTDDNKIESIVNNGEDKKDNTIVNNGEDKKDNNAEDNAIVNNGEDKKDNAIVNNGEDKKDNAIINNGEDNKDNAIVNNGEDKKNNNGEKSEDIDNVPDSAIKVVKKRSTDGFTNDGFYQNKSFFDDFISWFNNLFHSIPKPSVFNGTLPNGQIIFNGTYPNGTHFYNGTLPNGAVFEGGEFHNGNANGFFVTTHKNDSNGNSFSSSSSSSYSSGTSFGK